MRIILASKSPRRSQILKTIGFEFEVVNVDVEERKAEVHDLIQNAKRKVMAVKEEGLVIGADTCVLVDGKLLGKPKDREEAREMLRKLSGRKHTVITALCIRMGQKILCGTERTEVKFRKLSEEEIDAYISTSEPFDKAGAYGIQEKGAIFVESIKGDFFNVVGLPVNLLVKMLRILGVEPYTLWKSKDRGI